MEISSRLAELPPYLFVDLDRKREAAVKRGADVIHLGIGDPDLPTPPSIVDAGRRAMRNPAHHRYPLGAGLPALRRAIARWYKRRFGVVLDPDREVLVLIGSKEGIGHLPLALLSPGDAALVPDPGYPVYRTGTLLAGGRPITLPLTEERGFLPDLDAIPQDVAYQAKLLFLNYPNNPTGAAASPAFFASAAKWGQRHQVWIAHDAAYSEMYFGARPASFLAAPGAKEIGLEFHSLSKTFNMTGWRVGWACGNAKALAALGRVKDNYDSGAFGAVQEAAIHALEEGSKEAALMRAVYKRRRKLFIGGLRKLGWKVFDASTTFYVWTRLPSGWTSRKASERLIEEAAIVATPGNGFGAAGEGYLRFALAQPEARLKETLKRLAALKW